jgi:hypothetical protein
MMKNRILNRLVFGLSMLVLFASSCSEEFLEPTVSTSKDVNGNVNTVEDLEALMIGAYARMSTTSYYRRDYIIFAEVRSINAFSSGNSGRFVGPGQLSYNANDGNISSFWSQIYSVIANTNIVINTEVEDNESAEVQYVKGQAYAIRALAYMDLLRIFGQQYAGGDLGVPLVLQFRDENQFPERATVEETWNQIGQDLQTAADIMDPSLNSGDKTEVSTWMVYGLQSRYYLYTEQYQKVADVAKRVIDSGNFSILSGSSYIDSWGMDGAANVIFELAVTTADVNSFNTLYFIYHDTSYGDIEVTQDLYNIYGEDDIRQDLYSVEGETIRIVGKYPSDDFSDNIRVIRYAEVVLNYAEALARTNSPDALAFLNLIPENRNAETYDEATIENVLLERRKELALEGFGFFELVRNGMGIPKVDPRQTFGDQDIPFGSPRLALPIPQNEISANPSIIQNDGYN